MTLHTPKGTTKLIRKKIEIFDQKIGKDSPDRFKFTLKEFSKIEYAELRIQIGADKPSGIPLTSWKITKFILNDFTFFPSSPTNSVNIVHQSTRTCPAHERCLGQHLNTGENILLLFHDSPFFAGIGEIFTPDITARGELLVVGEQEINPVILITGGAIDVEHPLEEAEKKLEKLYKDNLPLAIFLSIIIVIIVVAIAFIIFRVGGGSAGVANQATQDVQGAQNG